jgi:hypothetical protein
MVVCGVDESDAKSESCQLLRKQQSGSDVSLGRKRDDDCVQSSAPPHNVVLPIATLTSVHLLSYQSRNTIPNQELSTINDRILSRSTLTALAWPWRRQHTDLGLCLPYLSQK